MTRGTEKRRRRERDKERGGKKEVRVLKRMRGKERCKEKG